jgi:hypothetical protein
VRRLRHAAQAVDARWRTVEAVEIILRDMI